MWDKKHILFLVTNMNHLQETVTNGTVNKLMEIAMKGSAS